MSCYGPIPDMPTVSGHVTLVTKSEIIERREPWTCPRTAPCSSADPVPPSGNPRVASDSDHAINQPCASWPRARRRNTSRGPKGIALPDTSCSATPCRPRSAPGWRLRRSPRRCPGHVHTGRTCCSPPRLSCRRQDLTGTPWTWCRMPGGARGHQCPADVSCAET